MAIRVTLGLGTAWSKDNSKMMLLNGFEADSRAEAVDTHCTDIKKELGGE